MERNAEAQDGERRAVSPYRKLARVERARRLRLSRWEDWLLTRGPAIVGAGYLAAGLAVCIAALMRLRGPAVLLAFAAVAAATAFCVSALRRRVERRLEVRVMALSLAEPLSSPVPWIDDRAYTLMRRDPLHWALTDAPPSADELAEAPRAVTLYEATAADALDVPHLPPLAPTPEGDPADLALALGATPGIARTLQRLPWPICCRRIATLRMIDLAPDRPRTPPHLRWLPVFQCSACAKIYSLDRR